MGENFDVFDVFQLGLQNLTRQIFKSITAFTGAWRKIVTICQNIFYQIFKRSLSVKISPHQNFALYGTYVILSIMHYATCFTWKVSSYSVSYSNYKGTLLHANILDNVLHIELHCKRFLIRTIRILPES